MIKYFLGLCLFSFSFANAQTSLPNFFGDNMVLQQQQQARIWGKDNPKTKIIVAASWGKTEQTTCDDKGNWKLKIQTPNAGGPYTVSIKGTKEIILKNVLVGEVWFCSGQSNMEMPVKGYNNQPIIGSNEFILNSANTNIRYFSSPRTSSLTPLYNVNNTWKEASPANTGNFSATAYFFAKKLQAVLGVPIGIIQASWGAATIESWMDKESLANFKNNQVPDTLPAKDPQTKPTLMYNSLLYPYIGYTIKGALWYQGEANRKNPEEYEALFAAMVGLWRTKWQQGDFPVYYAQIAPMVSTVLNAAYLREAQLKAMLSVKNVGMAVTLDIGEETVIHPAQKETVGNRLAYWALAKDYNIPGIAFSGPVFKKLDITPEKKLLVGFDYCDMGLNSFGKPLTDFEIADSSKVFFPAQAKLLNDKKDKVLVWSDSVKNPIHVRYGFKSWVNGSLYNTQGLPASSFRTDNW